MTSHTSTWRIVMRAAVHATAIVLMCAGFLAAVIIAEWYGAVAAIATALVWSGVTIFVLFSWIDLAHRARLREIESEKGRSSC